MMNIRKQKIIDTLNEKLLPEYLFVENESDQHSGPPGRESHFKVIATSEQFNTLSRVQRHQMVYKLLDDELKSGLHALALKLFTFDEWQSKKDQINLNSPNCSSKKHL